MTTRFHVSWERLAFQVEMIAQQALEFAPTVILAVARGGLIPATMLAHKLDVRQIETINVTSYGEGYKLDTFAMGAPPFIPDEARVLIVDDLLDTGATLDAVTRLFPNAKTAVLVNKHPTLSADYVGETPSFPAWIVFPWEK